MKLITEIRLRRHVSAQIQNLNASYFNKPHNLRRKSDSRVQLYRCSLPPSNNPLRLVPFSILPNRARLTPRRTQRRAQSGIFSHDAPLKKSRCVGAGRAPQGAMPKLSADEAARQQHKLERTLVSIKACNRADFLYAWKERIRPSPSAARARGVKRLSHVSTPSSVGVDDDDELAETDDEDDVDPVFNERRLDALHMLRSMPALNAVSEWMLALRRKYLCHVSPLDYDLANGVMALETLYICLPELFMSPNGDLMNLGRALSELSLQRDPASPPPSRPTSTSVAGISPPFKAPAVPIVPSPKPGTIEKMCGVEKEMDEECTAGERNMRKLVVLMEKFQIYDWYRNGKPAPPIDYSAVHKAHLLAYIFVLAVNGSRRRKIIDHLATLDHDIQDQLQGVVDECFKGFHLSPAPDLFSESYEELRMENGVHVGLPFDGEISDEVEEEEVHAPIKYIHEAGSEAGEPESKPVMHIDSFSTPTRPAQTSSPKRIGPAKRKMTPKKMSAIESLDVRAGDRGGMTEDDRKMQNLTNLLEQHRQRAESQHKVVSALENKIHLLENEKEILEKHSAKLTILTNKLSEQKELFAAENRRLQVEVEKAMHYADEVKRMQKEVEKSRLGERAAKHKLAETQKALQAADLELGQTKRELLSLRAQDETESKLRAAPVRSGRMLSSMVSGTHLRREPRSTRIGMVGALAASRQENAKLRRELVEMKRTLDTKLRDEERQKARDDRVKDANVKKGNSFGGNLFRRRQPAR